MSASGLHRFMAQSFRNFQYIKYHFNQQRGMKVETTWRTYAHLYPDKEKILVTQGEFENEVELDENIEAGLAVAEIFQSGYLEICGLVYCLASLGAYPVGRQGRLFFMLVYVDKQGKQKCTAHGLARCHGAKLKPGNPHKC